MNVIEMKRRGKDNFKPEDFQRQELYRLLNKLEFHKYKMVKRLNEYWFKIAYMTDLKPDPNQMISHKWGIYDMDHIRWLNKPV